MFIFQFEKILSIKSKLLDDKMIKISMLEDKIKSLKREKYELNMENRLRREKIFRILNSENPDRNMIVFLGELAQKIDENIEKIQEEIEFLSREKIKLIEEAKSLLKEKKRLERLKDRRFEEYRIELTRSETRFLDEITSTKVASRYLNGS